MNTWPFKIRIEGNDIVVRDVVITCFGGWGSGIADPQDDGRTASGLNTRLHALKAVSIPMNGRDFSFPDPAVHRALDDCPIPRLRNYLGLTAWHTLVEVTIGGETWTPEAGIIDLGPGLQATKNTNAPHALDLTPLAAIHWAPKMSLRQLANSFEARGSYRIKDGALFAGFVKPSIPAT